MDAAATRGGVSTVTSRAGVSTVTASHTTPAASAIEDLSAAAKSAGVSSSGHAADGRVNVAETVTFAASVTAESSQVVGGAEVHGPEPHGCKVRVKSFSSGQLPPPLAGVVMLRVASQVPPSHSFEQLDEQENALTTQFTARDAYQDSGKGR